MQFHGIMHANSIFYPSSNPFLIPWSTRSTKVTQKTEGLGQDELGHSWMSDDARLGMSARLETSWMSRVSYDGVMWRCHEKKVLMTMWSWDIEVSYECDEVCAKPILKIIHTNMLMHHSQCKIHIAYNLIY